jgi:molybdopterin/thiamine biosynthesis adenylyltransferase
MRTVVIVGAGALGSHVALFLRNEDVVLRVVDFDRVEQKNTLAQFHGRPKLGVPKTESLRTTLQFLFGTKIEVRPYRLTADNISEICGGTALMVDCLDNAKSRKLVQAFSEQGAVPCVHGALAAAGGFGRVVWGEQFVPDEETAGAATCTAGEHLPFIALTAAYLARAVQLFLATGEQRGYAISPGGAVPV